MIALIVLVAGGLLVVLLSREKTGPERVAAGLSQVGCDLGDGIHEPLRHPPTYLRGAGRTASLDCGGAAVVVTWGKFVSGEAARASLRRKSGRYPRCIAGDEIVVAEELRERDFAGLCHDLNGDVVVPLRPHWARY